MEPVEKSRQTAGYTPSHRATGPAQTFTEPCPVREHRRRAREHRPPTPGPETSEVKVPEPLAPKRRSLRFNLVSVYGSGEDFRSLSWDRVDVKSGALGV